MKTNILLPIAALFCLVCAGCWTLERVEPPCLEITDFFPKGAQFGDTVTITGRNFCEGRPDLHRIKIGDVPVSNIIDVPNGETIRFTVPKIENAAQISAQLVTAAFCAPAVSNELFYYYYTTSSVIIIAGNPSDADCPTCLSSPMGLDIKANGDLYVADRNHHCIQQIKTTPTSGTPVTLIAGRKDLPTGDWKDDANGLFARFNAPSDVAVDENDNIYVADEFNYRIRLINNASIRSVSTISGGDPGDADNVIVRDARFLRPASIALNKNLKKLYVSEFTGHRVRELDLLPGGLAKTIANASSPPNDLDFPSGVDFFPSFTTDYSVLVVDAGHVAVRGIGSNYTLFNVTNLQFSPFSQPYGITINDKSVIFVTDQEEVFAIYPDHTIQSIAGKGNKFTFSRPAGIAVDNNKKAVYVSDSGANVVVKIQLE